MSASTATWHLAASPGRSGRHPRPPHERHHRRSPGRRGEMNSRFRPAARRTAVRSTARSRSAQASTMARLPLPISATATKPVLQGDRDYSACVLQNTAGGVLAAAVRRQQIRPQSCSRTARRRCGTRARNDRDQNLWLRSAELLPAPRRTLHRRRLCRYEVDPAFKPYRVHVHGRPDTGADRRRRLRQYDDDQLRRSAYVCPAIAAICGRRKI